MISEKIAIIILNWNGKNDTLDCLQSVSQLSYPYLEVIVIDNGSTDNSAEAIQQHYPQYTLIQTEENLGFAEGNNIGIRIALQNECDWVLLLNNDTQVASDLIERFLETAQQIPQAGILGAKLLQFSRPDVLDHFGGKWNQKRAVFDLIGKGERQEAWNTPEQLDYVCAAAFFAKACVFKEIGLLEPKFFLIWEEADFCVRAAKKGFFSFTAPSARVLHKVSQSFSGGKAHTNYFWWRNRLLWIRRNCSHTEQLSFLCRILIPETLHKLKLHLLKTVQLALQKEPPAHKKQFLTKNAAELIGIRDFFLQRWGSGSVKRFLP